MIEDTSYTITNYHMYRSCQKQWVETCKEKRGKFCKLNCNMWRIDFNYSKSLIEKRNSCCMLRETCSPDSLNNSYNILEIKKVIFNYSNCRRDLSRGFKYSFYRLNLQYFTTFKNFIHDQRNEALCYPQYRSSNYVDSHIIHLAFNSSYFYSVTDKNLSKDEFLSLK